MDVIYDKYFNQNEWYVIITLIIGILLLLKTKKRFPLENSILYFLYCFFIGMIVDHTIGTPPFDFYDINDTSRYEFFDFLTYFMFSSYGYLFIYLFDRFKIKSSYAPIYVLVWSCISMVMEVIADYMGVFHYKNGYNIYYSFPIYLSTQSMLLYLYKSLNSNNKAI